MAKALNPDFVVEFVVSWRKDSGVDGRNMYPGIDACDTIGIDAYCLTQDQGSMTAAEHAAFMFTAPYGINFWRDFAVAQGKPFTIPEWATNYDNPVFVQMMADFIRDNNVVYHSYWDQNNGVFTCKLSADERPNAANAFVRNFGPFTINTWALSAAPNAALSAPITASKRIAKIEVVGGIGTVLGLNVQALAQASGSRRITVRATDERGLIATRSVALTWQAGTLWTPDAYFGSDLADAYDPGDASNIQRHLGGIKYEASRLGGRKANALAAAQRPTFTIDAKGRGVMSLSGSQALVQTDLTGSPAAQTAITIAVQVITNLGAGNFLYFYADSDGTGGATGTRSLGVNGGNLRVQGNGAALAGDALVGAERTVIASIGAGASAAVSTVVDGGPAKTGTVAQAAGPFTKRVLGGTGSTSDAIGSYYPGGLVDKLVIKRLCTPMEVDYLTGFLTWKNATETGAIFQASASAFKAGPPMLP